jgi:carboxyl-terminal processing protease
LSRLWIIALALAYASHACGEPPGDSPLSPEQKRLNIQSFEFVWSTIRDQYWAPDFGGVNWNSVREELWPKIQHASSMMEARAVMREMLARLGKSHFAIIPADVYSDLKDPEQAAGSATAGLDVRVIGGQAVVTGLDDGSTAAAQGVRLGWEIVAVDGVSLAPRLHRIAEHYRNSTAAELYMARAVFARLDGEAGSKVRVEFVDGTGKHVTKQIERAEPPGALARFGYLPPMHVWFKTRRLSGDTGYIAFNLFLDPARLMPSFGNAVHSCADCAGLIIDLRGNPGGLGIMALGMAGWFLDKPDQRLGTMRTRQAPVKFTVNPRLPVYDGRLAILVDGCSASTSEIFAGGLKDLGRARVFGTRTAGAALPSAIDRLPNGDGFQHAVADYVSESGRTLEGAGVIPDVEVKLTREALLVGHDPVLDAAIKWIHAAK